MQACGLRLPSPPRLLEPRALPLIETVTAEFWLSQGSCDGVCHPSHITDVKTEAYQGKKACST